MSEEENGDGGCTLILIGIALVAWLAWSFLSGCFMADQFDYVTKKCALEHLRKPACNAERDILGVDEITDVSFKDSQGRQNEMRSIIYSFRKRPTDGPVSAGVFRDTATMFKASEGKWLASCENVSSK